MDCTLLAKVRTDLSTVMVLIVITNFAVTLFSTMLGLRSNTCFACGRRGLSSGTLVIRTQTLTLTHD